MSAIADPASALAADIGGAVDTATRPVRATREAADETFLGELGRRVRRLRSSRGMSRKVLAEVSGISERYIAQLESGRGNVSIVLLRRVAAATAATLEELVGEA
ncbi:MAG: helix-turn-helix domain-containing protein, partial [Phyllobacteriaceae bacterium]|nr:helix-turn-helix domain-containing protein [Phyllobacteriaceae bacterium]